MMGLGDKMSGAKRYGRERYAHDFALWAAARAAQRGASGAKTHVLAEAFCKARLPEIFEQELSSSWANDEAFDREHATWCEKFLNALPDDVSFSFGRAAKFIAIYLKVTIVLPGRGEDSEFVKKLHPPIDRVLLSAVYKKLDRTVGKAKLGAWTKFGAKEYADALSNVRQAVRVDAMWKAEELWQPFEDAEDDEGINPSA